MFGTILYFLIKVLPMWICLFLLCLPFILFSVRKSGEKANWLCWLIQYAFLSYLIFVLAIGGVTGILFFLQNPTYFRASTITVNIIPFVDLFSDPMQYFANILLFIPFGLLFPLLFPQNQLRSTLLSGIIFSSSIEILQAFSLRTPDINDMLMNVLGTLIGYFLFYFLINQTTLKYRTSQQKFKMKEFSIKFYFLVSYLFIFVFDFFTRLASPISTP